MINLLPLKANEVRHGIMFSQGLILCIFFCLLCPGLNAQAAYDIDGTLRDWGVDPNNNWVPYSATADYIVTDNVNTYDANSYYEEIFDVEALYFDDDDNFFYFAVVTKFAFAVFHVGSRPVPRTGPRSAGDLGIDFDISSEGIPNSDIGMNITEHGRVVMQGPPENSELGLDYGVRIGSTAYGPLGQVITQPFWDKTKHYYYENEGWQNGPWRMNKSEPEAVVALANIAFGLESGSYIVEGAIPKRVFPEASKDGLVGLHITMYCGNDAANLVASYSGYSPPEQGFFPLNLKKEIKNVNYYDQQTPAVNPGDLIDYLITYSNDRNTDQVTDVVLIDALPPEVIFVESVGSDTEGYYDPNEHTFTCMYPSLLPSESGAIHLKVRVNDFVTTDTFITNIATIDSNETESTTTTANAIVKTTTLEPLVISKVILVGGEDLDYQDFHLVDVGELITYGICFSNPNSKSAKHLSILDILPTEMTFINANEDSDFGHYDPNTHTYTWNLLELKAGKSQCLELTAQVKPFTPPFTQVVNRVTIDSDQTESSIAEIGAIVKPINYRPLNTSKQIISVNNEKVSMTIPLVEPGDILTYRIFFDNLPNDHLAQNITVVDHLPAEVTFVNDDSMQRFGSYDPNTHSYTRRYPSLTPSSGTYFTLIVKVRDDMLPDTLIQNDLIVDSDETDPNTATAFALVRMPLEVTMQCSPLILGREGVNRTVNLLTVLEMPQGILSSDIQPEPLILEPGFSAALSQEIFVENGKTKIRAFFALTDLFQSVPANGITQLTVRGRLKDGRGYFAQSLVLIVQERPF